LLDQFSWKEDELEVGLLEEYDGVSIVGMEESTSWLMRSGCCDPRGATQATIIKLRISSKFNNYVNKPHYILVL
jgi:hypothetical protein